MDTLSTAQSRIIYPTKSPETPFLWIGKMKHRRNSYHKTTYHSPLSSAENWEIFSPKTLFLPFQVIVGIAQSLWILNNDSPKISLLKGADTSQYRRYRRLDFTHTCLYAWIWFDCMTCKQNRCSLCEVNILFFSEVQNLPKQKILGCWPSFRKKYSAWPTKQ